MALLAGFLSLASERLGTIIDALKTILEVRDFFENCDSPVGAWLAGLAIAFFVCGVLLFSVITILIAGPLGLVVGALASFLFGAIMGTMLDLIRRAQCFGRRRVEVAHS